MKKGNLRSSALLLLTACIWGVAFVAQSVGMEYVEPFTFNFVRSILGGLVLIPCIFFMHGRKDSIWQTLSEKEKKEQTRMGIIGGIISSFFKGLFKFLISFFTSSDKFNNLIVLVI